MHIDIEHVPGEDFGTVSLTLDRDDDGALIVSNGLPEIRFPLFSHEARELLDALLPLAQTPEAR